MEELHDLSRVRSLTRPVGEEVEQRPRAASRPQAHDPRARELGFLGKKPRRCANVTLVERRDRSDGERVILAKFELLLDHP
jgi:hypothetical protein